MADSVVLASPTSVPADGKTSATIYVLLSDANGDPIGGKAVTVAASSGLLHRERERYDEPGRGSDIHCHGLDPRVRELHRH